MLLKTASSNYYCCCICEKGTPDHNDDCVILGKDVFCDDSISKKLRSNFFIGVADGVSNSQNGQLASILCLQALAKARVFKKTNLAKTVLNIHRKIIAYGEKNKQLKNMQTTLCALHISKKGTLRYVNVGDSRLYRFKNNNLTQISKDQSFVQMLYDKGKIPHEQKRLHSGRNLVLSVIGSDDDNIKPEYEHIDDKFEFGDIFLLCTDGLSDYVLDTDIEAVLALPLPLETRLQKLCENALQNGCTDNISICAVTKIK